MNTKILVTIVFIIGIILGAIGMYAFSVYHTFNALATIEDAPFMQGFMMGIGSGSALMYEYYFYPDLNSIEEFEEVYDYKKIQFDINKAFHETITGKMVFKSIEKYQDDDGIYEWIMRTEERNRRGVLGFTVPIKKIEKGAN